MRWSYDGPTVLAEVQRSAPAVVLADAMLPGLDGAALADRLRTRPDPIPVVLMGDGPTPSGHAAIPSVPKPLALPDLLAALAAILAPDPDAPGSDRSLP